MQPVRVVHVSGVVAALAACAMALGCSGITHPSASSPSVKKGELGNGGFTFKCDDSVACDRWNNADEFPSDVALGSTFELDFLLRQDSRGFVWLKDAERGTTIEPVGKYINRGSSGFAAVEPGIATISARDQKGWLVDYITVRVARPTGLVVYDADYRGDDPERLATISLQNGDRRSFRTVAQQAGRTLAGLITVEWTSDDKNVVAIEGYSRGQVTIIAKGKGTAVLTAKGGGGLVQNIDVEVTDGTPTQDAGSDAETDASQDGG